MTRLTRMPQAAPLCRHGHTGSSQKSGGGRLSNYPPNPSPSQPGRTYCLLSGLGCRGRGGRSESRWVQWGLPGPVWQSLGLAPQDHRHGPGPHWHSSDKGASPHVRAGALERGVLGGGGCGKGWSCFASAGPGAAQGWLNHAHQSARAFCANTSACDT
jgi:hypothetical protein